MGILTDVMEQIRYRHLGEAQPGFEISKTDE